MRTTWVRFLAIGWALAMLLTALPADVLAQGAPARYALVFGNSRYEGDGWPSLKAPANDARAVAGALRQIGFQVVGCGAEGVCLDTNRTDMEAAIHEFARQLQAHPGAIAFFYYSGHAVQVQRAGNGPYENYLIPVKSGIQSERDVENRALPAQRVLDAIADTDIEAGIVVLDSCRTNPLAASQRGLVEHGLARMQAPGLLIAYSAEAGQVALDSLPGSAAAGPAMSPYARRLSEQLVIHGKSVADVFSEVRTLVMADTDGEQRPEFVMRLAHNLYLAGPPSQPQADRPAAQGDSAFWVPARRVALVIGNSGYGGKTAPGNEITWPDLERGPLKDADLMTKRLQELKFQVTELKDQNIDQMNAGLLQFADSITPDSLALFYYSGHGTHAPRGLGPDDGEDNYLVPVATDLAWDYQANYKALALTQVSSALKRSRGAIIILDACRNNALHRRTKAALERGLAGAQNISGMLIAYSTPAGEVAVNRPDQPSQYTQLLSQMLGRPGESLTAAFRAVRRQMRTLSGSDRLPETTDQLDDEIVLVER
jgi:uncharacterized caspase-like protein